MSSEATRFDGFGHWCAFPPVFSPRSKHTFPGLLSPSTRGDEGAIILRHGAHLGTLIRQTIETPARSPHTDFRLQGCFDSSRWSDRR